eukprot:jgi/Psemu1/285602/fgenesh1_pg.94_\
MLVYEYAFSGAHPPPVLLVNAAVSLVALVGLVLSPSSSSSSSREDNAANEVVPLSLPLLPLSPSAESSTDNPNTDANANPNANPNANTNAIPTQAQAQQARSNPSVVGGLELGAWKFLGTTLNLYGLALTTASHGALLIQLTTLIVPTCRGIFYKETIPNRVKLSIGLAVAGVICFSQDGLGPGLGLAGVTNAAAATAAATTNGDTIDAMVAAAATATSAATATTTATTTTSGSTRLVGDGLCVLAAVCYSAYDLRLYEYGKKVEDDKELITNKIAVQACLSVLLLGVAVNAVAPLLQVGGQQVVGPTKCQTLYASQPLWAAILSYVWLGETLANPKT